jgi:hypothetical protein
MIVRFFMRDITNLNRGYMNSLTNWSFDNIRNKIFGKLLTKPNLVSS